MLNKIRKRQVDYTWPGFVDALSSLLMVIIFVLMIFVLSQFFLSQKMTGQDEALVELRNNLVELGELNTDHPDALVTASKFFIHKVVIGVTTAAASDANSLANLQLSATSGTATNTAVSSGTEIVGAGVTSFNEQLSATQSITEVDVNFNNTAGNYHIFVPNITAAIASKNLYAFATTAVNADITAGRFTVELEYSVY